METLTVRRLSLNQLHKCFRSKFNFNSRSQALLEEKYITVSSAYKDISQWFTQEGKSLTNIRNSRGPETLTGTCFKEEKKGIVNSIKDFSP